MTRTIFISGLFTVLLLAAGTVGFSLGQVDSSDSGVACDSELLSKPVSFTGSATGPRVTGAAQVALNVDVAKGTVTGFAKGKSDNAKWNVGLSGTYNKKDKTISVTGTNKTNTLTLKGSVCGKQFHGVANGKVLDKDAWMLVTASK